jgi:hypothetical protein
MKLLKLELCPLREKEGITFVTTLVFHEQNNNINLKTYYQRQCKQPNINITTGKSL